MKIVFADDNLLISETVAMLCEGEPFELVVCTDGQQAWDAVQRADIDLVITDIQMPAMNGFELLANIRKHFPQLPVVGISGDEMVRPSDSEFWFEETVLKPPRDILALIARYSR
jgi:CheY-like chemotaxis protein